MSIPLDNTQFLAEDDAQYVRPSFTFAVADVRRAVAEHQRTRLELLSALEQLRIIVADGQEK